MNTTTPPPRLVPDRPSDAAIAHAFREFDDCGKHSAEQCAFLAEMFDRAREIDAAAPPAEAPGDEFPQDVGEALDALETMEGDIDGDTVCTDTVSQHIAALTARVAIQTAALESAQTRIASCEAALEQAEAKAEASARDAGRYRWLRQVGSAQSDVACSYVGKELDAACDAAIDAAMQEPNP